MGTVTGQVEAKSNKYNKFAILVGGTWYSSLYEVPCERGDTVEFEDEGKRYCKKLRVISSGGAVSSVTSAHTGAVPQPTSSTQRRFPVPVDAPDRSIIRQNSLAHATNLVIALLGTGDTETAIHNSVSDEDLAQQVIRLARQFESYSAGDSDMQEAMAIINKTDRYT